MRNNRDPLASHIKFLEREVERYQRERNGVAESVRAHWLHEARNVRQRIREGMTVKQPEVTKMSYEEMKRKRGAR